MFSHFKKKLEQVLLHERSPKKIALASSLAIYIAFCPFIGFHTLMLIAGGWLFRLNIPLLIAISYIVNNPWTMIPIFASGYALGYSLLHVFLAIPIAQTNPEWMHFVNTYLYTYLTIKDLSFWAFIVGANLLGIVLSIIIYPISYYIAHNWKKL